MKTLNLVQGSDEWAAERARYRTASEASMMMGCHKISRSELLRMKATGDEKEYSRWTLDVLFARGHEVEEDARPIAEEILGVELFPATITDDDDYLLASLDGMSMDDVIFWECKQWNQEKADSVVLGNVPQEDYWQFVHQFAANVAERGMYMVTDGTKEKSEYVLVHRSEVEADIKVLRAHWAQFDTDLANYTPTESAPVVVGRAPDQLPALVVETKGAVIASNLDAFKEHAFDVLNSINRDLSTDEDFANADKAVKWCSDVEKKLELAKESILAQTSDIDKVLRTVDQVKAHTRDIRLELEKLSKARKVAIRDEILAGAKREFQLFTLELNASINDRRVSVQIQTPDFAGVMKGKKSVTSLGDAVNTEMARVKVEAGQLATTIRTNLNAIQEYDAEYGGLFRDLQSLVAKQPEDFIAVVKLRVSEEKERRQKAEDARIAAEAEKKRLADEAEAQRVAAEAAEVERKRLEDEANKQAPPPVAVTTPAAPVAETAAPVAAAAPAAVVVTGSAPLGQQRAKPSDREIVQAVATVFHVPSAVAVKWLKDMDLSPDRLNLASNF